MFLFEKLTFQVCRKFKTFKSFKITLYFLQNKIHQLNKLFSKLS